MQNIDFLKQALSGIEDPRINIAVRLRDKKKVQNLSEVWYKKLPQQLATQGDFGHESPYYTLFSVAIPDTWTSFSGSSG